MYINRVTQQCFPILPHSWLALYFLLLIENGISFQELTNQMTPFFHYSTSIMFACVLYTLITRFSNYNLLQNDLISLSLVEEVARCMHEG